MTNITTPLYLRIELPTNFPNVKPFIMVMSYVVHDNIDSGSKEVHTPLLEHWDMYKNNSTLLATIRDIHEKFEHKKPLPEKLA